MTVAPMQIDFSAIRTPPSSVIATTFTIAAGPFGSEVEQVRIYMPAGFTQGTEEGYYAENELDEFEDTGRKIAKLDLLYSQRTTLAAQGLVLNPRVKAPSVPDEDARCLPCSTNGQVML